MNSKHYWTTIHGHSIQSHLIIIIHNKLVYKIKQKPDGSVDRYKTRLVAKRFNQRSGINYFETFSPIVKPTTICIILFLAVQLSPMLFFKGILMRKYILSNRKSLSVLSILIFFVAYFALFMALSRHHELGLLISHNFNFELVFSSTYVDYSLFTLYRDKSHIFILVYVDDIIVIGNNETIIFSVIS